MDLINIHLCLIDSPATFLVALPDYGFPIFQVRNFLDLYWLVVICALLSGVWTLVGPCKHRRLLQGDWGSESVRCAHH